MLIEDRNATLLAPRDVAHRLNLSTSRVIQLDREGVLRASRDRSGRRFYDADVVERFAAAREAARSEPMPGRRAHASEPNAAHA